MGLPLLSVMMSVAWHRDTTEPLLGSRIIDGSHTVVAGARWYYSVARRHSTQCRWVIASLGVLAPVTAIGVSLQ